MLSRHAGNEYEGWVKIMNWFRLAHNKPSVDILNVFIDIQTSKERIQIDTDKMMTYGTFTMDDEKLSQS